jgi:hypothetical protein
MNVDGKKYGLQKKLHFGTERDRSTKGGSLCFFFFFLVARISIVFGSLEVSLVILERIGTDS